MRMKNKLISKIITLSCMIMCMFLMGCEEPNNGSGHKKPTPGRYEILECCSIGEGTVFPYAKIVVPEGESITITVKPKEGNKIYIAGFIRNIKDAWWGPKSVKRDIEKDLTDKIVDDKITFAYDEIDDGAFCVVFVDNEYNPNCEFQLSEDKTYYRALLNVDPIEKVEEVIIPETYHNLPVKEIANFAGNDIITKVVLPNTLTKLGEGAFRNCKSLKEVVLPESLTEIGKEAFLGCEALEKVNIPNNVTALNERVFSGCVNLTGIEIPSGMKKIKTEAFNDCKKITSIKLNDNMEELGTNWIKGCTGLKKLVLGEGVKRINYEMIYECEELELTLPSTYIFDNATLYYVKEITAYVEIASNNPRYKSVDGIVYDKEMTKIIIYPKHLKTESYLAPDTLKELTFMNVSNKYLKRVDLSLTTGMQLKQACLSNCSSLEELILPNKISCLEQIITTLCNLNKITMAGENETYEVDGKTIVNKETKTLLMIIDNTAKIGEDIKRIENYAAQSYQNEEFIVPETIEEIGRHVFSKKIKTIKIGKNVKKMDVRAFDSASVLERIEVSEENMFYTTIDGVLYDKNIETLLHYPDGKTDEKYVMPSTITTVIQTLNPKSLKEVEINANIVARPRFVFENLEKAYIKGEGKSYGGVSALFSRYDYDVPDGCEIYFEGTIEELNAIGYDFTEIKKGRFILYVLDKDNEYSEYQVWKD